MISKVVSRDKVKKNLKVGSLMMYSIKNKRYCRHKKTLLRFLLTEKKETKKKERVCLDESCNHFINNLSKCVSPS